MKIIKSKEIGFCFGVRNAYDITSNALLENSSIYSIGPLIHNKRVISELEEKGVKVIKNPDDQEPKKAIIRSHGLSFREREEYEKKGYTLLDATCPIVLKNQIKARDAENLIIIGSLKHSEVKTLLNQNFKTPVIEKLKDLDNLNKEVDYNAIIQTTFSSIALKEIKGEIEKRNLKVNFLNNICNVSDKRRTEIELLSSVCDAIIVIGDKDSENSKSLAELAMSLEKPTFFIENESEVAKNMLNYDVIGISSGASCPDYLVEKVINKLNEVNNGKI